MKRHNLFFLGILVPLDYLALILAAISAYSLRFGPFSELLQTTITISFTDYLANAAFFALIFVIIYAFSGLYADRVRRRLAAEFPRIVTASSTGIAILIVAIFFQRQYFASRFIVLAAWIFAIAYVFAGRGLVRLVRYLLLRSGYGILRFAAIGTPDTADAIVQAYGHERRWGTKIYARFPSWNDTTREQLAAMRERELIDGIILTDPSRPREEILAIQSFADDNHLAFRYVADLLGTEHASIETIMLASLPIVEVKRTPLEGWGAIAKRAFDLAVAGTLTIILSPILLAVAVAVKIGSRGPIIFQNERVGERGKIFNTYKFRSMYADKSIGNQGGLGNQDEALKLEEQLIKERSIKAGPVYKIQNDPRVTPVGSFIRATSLDELPQLFNVLAGTMSLVGPRPHQPREVAKYLPSQKRVLAIKPGVTGLAQISGRSDIPFEEEVRLDNYYIEHWSPYLDLIILVKTPLAVFSRKGTY